MLKRLWKPWFVYRPTQLIRRAILMMASPAPGFQLLQTSWGVPLLADPSKTIGWSILSTGLYDIAISELLARLINPGDTVIDAGANIGYMTLLAAVAAGPSGKVLAFEPHPELFSILQKNVLDTQAWLPIAATKIYQSALGDHQGSAELLLPLEFNSNDGTARVGTSNDSNVRSVSVTMETLDAAVGDGTAAVMKLDVEGFEAHVLLGATRLLRERRVKHIVFEDHGIETSEVVPMLCEAGYQVYSLGWSINGINFVPIGAGKLAGEYEAPNFVATVNSDELLARCEPRGWSVLDDGLVKNCRRSK